MNPLLASLKRLFPERVTKEQLKIIVPDMITAAQYEEITGDTFEA